MHRAPLLLAPFPHIELVYRGAWARLDVAVRRARARRHLAISPPPTVR